MTANTWSKESWSPRRARTTLTALEAALPPVSNYLFEEFPELRSVDHLAIRSTCPQPYVEHPTGQRRRLERTLYLTGVTHCSTHPDTRDATTGSSVAGATHPKRNKQPSSFGATNDSRLAGGSHSKRSQHPNAFGATNDSRLAGGPRVYLGTINSTWGRCTVDSLRSRRLPPEPWYVSAHQQSCEMCHAQAVKVFHHAEVKVRQSEHSSRLVIVDQELEARRLLYREFLPLHTKLRMMLDSNLVALQLQRALEELRAQLQVVEQEEEEARAAMESELLPLLRAMRRCCYRKAWQRSAELEVAALAELRRVKELEAAEAAAALAELQRQAKLHATMVKQLIEHEGRRRQEELSEEFKSWVKLMFKHQESAEAAAEEAQQRVERTQQAERASVEVQLMQKRHRAEEEERESRQGLRARFLKGQALLKERPLNVRVAEFCALEALTRAQKEAVLGETFHYMVLSLVDSEEALYRTTLAAKAEAGALECAVAAGIATPPQLEVLEGFVRAELETIHAVCDDELWSDISHHTVASKLATDLLLWY